jgi:hypothetical protein
MSRLRDRGRRAHTHRDPALYAVLFVTLGLVGAFLVSAIAAIGGRQLAETPSPFADGDARTLADAPKVRIEVLNGAGVAGLAREATQQLRGVGFDVVFFGNAGRFDHGRSVVIDRSGDLDMARAVAAALGIDSVASAVDSTLFLDATVVLGSDWPPPPPAGAGALQRLRRLVAPPDTAS